MKKTYLFCTAVLSSFFLCSSAAGDADTLAVSRFSEWKDKPISSEWKIKEWKGKADVRIVSDNDKGKAACLKSSQTSTALYKEIEFDIKDYPVLNWSWKVSAVPAGADVRKKETDDQAAQIYVVFPKFPSQVNSRMLGYIWDSTAPAGSEVTSTKFSKVKYIVLKSGTNEVGKWFAEKRNVHEDYKRLFGEEPPKVGSVSLMIDSDDTKSGAECLFGDIYFSKQ